MDKVTHDKFVDVCGGLGFSVYADGDEYELTAHSGGYEGCVRLSGATLAELAASAAEVHENFDVDYETYLCLDESGHGCNGAPHHIRDILDELEGFEGMLDELVKALEDAASEADEGVTLALRGG